MSYQFNGSNRVYLAISELLRGHIAYNVKKSPCWAAMVDEKTDIAALQQYIAFVQYVNTTECQATPLIDEMILVPITILMSASMSLFHVIEQSQ